MPSFWQIDYLIYVRIQDFHHFRTISKLGCDEFVHHFETVVGLTPNCSHSHLFVFFFSANNIFSRLISRILLASIFQNSDIMQK